MSLLQSPRRPSTDVLALGPTGSAFDPNLAFSGSGGLRDDDGPRVDLGRELDLSSERPHANAPAGRGSGALVASIVASSLVLAGIIMLVRGDATPTQPNGPSPAPRTEVVSAPEVLPVEAAPVEAAPVEAAPADPPRRVAAPREPAATKEPAASADITPAAIAPTSSSRPTAPSATPGEAAPTGGLAPGLHLPAPVFDDAEPTAPVEPAPLPAPSPSDEGGGALDTLPGVDERAPALPEVEPEAVPELREPSAPAAP